MAARPKLVGDPDYLDPSWAREPAETAQAGIQADCDICGLVGAGCFGFGASRTSRGVWACTDADCRAEAEAKTHETTTLIAAE